MNILIVVEYNKIHNKLEQFIRSYQNENLTFLLNSTSEKYILDILKKIDKEIDYKIINSDTTKSQIKNILNNELTDILSVSNYEKYSNHGKNNNSQKNFIFSDLFEKNQFKTLHIENFIKYLFYEINLDNIKFDKIFTKNLDSFSKYYLLKHNLIYKKVNLFKFYKIKNILISCVFLGHFFSRMLLLKPIFLFKNINYNNTNIFASYFPFFPSNPTYSLENDCLYYSKMTKYFDKKKNIWFLHSIKSINISFFKYLKYIFKTDSNITLLENEIKIIDYLFFCFYFLFINLFNKFEYNSKIDKIYYKNISSYLNYSLSYSLSSKNFVYASLCYYSYKAFYKKIKFNSNILYLFEMQLWETALNYAKNSNIKSIAYNHTAISKHYIFFFKSKNDFINKNFLKILPDKIAYNGEYHFNLLKNYYPNLQHRFVESLRFTHLTNFKNEKIFKKDNHILFLFSINKFETNWLLNIISHICEDRRFDNYNLSIKFHPSLKLQIFNNKMKNRIFIVNDINYMEYLKKSNYVICGTTSSSIEALYFYCKIIIPDYLSSYFKPPLCDHNTFFKSFKSIDHLHEILSKNKKIKIKGSREFARDYWDINYNKPQKLINYLNE